MFAPLHAVSEGVFPRVLGSACFADGVAVFWMITGFFMFGNANYKKMLVRTTKKILVPMALLSLFAFFTFDWYAGFRPLIDSVTKSPEQIETALKSIFEWHNTINGVDHLWYLYTYILLVLIFPILKPIARELGGESARSEGGEGTGGEGGARKSDNRQLYFLVAVFAVFALNDFSENRLFEFSNRGLNSLIPAALEVFWGYILYKNSHLFRGNKKYGWIAIALFFAANIVRALVLSYKYSIGGANNILWWFSSFSLITASCIIIACFAFVPKEAKGRVGKLILEAGSCAFAIYMIHMVLRDTIIINYDNPFYQFFLGGKQGAYDVTTFCLEVAYMVCSVAFVYFVSLLVVLAWRRARRVVDCLKPKERGRS